METSVECYRISLPKLKNTSKHKSPKPKKRKAKSPKPSKNKSPPPKECDPEDSPCCVTCRLVHSKTCGSQKRKERCEKELPLVFPSYSSLSKSMQGNSKYCCCALARFLEEAGRMVQGDPNAKIHETLSEMTEAMIAIANDVILSIGKMTCASINLVKSKSKQVHRKICAYVATFRSHVAKNADKIKTKVTSNFIPSSTSKSESKLKSKLSSISKPTSKIFKTKQSKRPKRNKTKKKWWKKEKKTLKSNPIQSNPKLPRKRRYGILVFPKAEELRAAIAANA